MGVILDLEHLSPDDTLTTKKSKQMFKTTIFSLAPRPKGPTGKYRSGQPSEVDLRGLECNHASLKQPEAKNHS